MITSDDLLRDFAAFADPATEPVVAEGRDNLDVKLIREAEEVRFTINRASGTVSLRARTMRKLPSVAALLADPLFANLRALNATQRQMNANFDESDFIEPEGSLYLSDGAPRKLDIQSLDGVLLPANLPNKKTRVVLLDGQAGVGKTSLIQRLLVRRTHNLNVPPIVHVISRGNRLFGLNQLLAAALDTLRAKFTFDQAPVLLRHHLIEIAIDGFDELVDSEGYSDSWTALADFLSEIGPGGAVILAGRDTFFDQQVFRERLGRISDQIDLIGARLMPVRASRARDYLLQHGWANSELSFGPGLDVLREGSYALRPYFLRTLAVAGEKDWSTLLGGRTLRAYLVESFLQREANLVRTRTHLSQAVAVERLREVFSEIALEMAASETSVVDTSFIELVIETVFINDLSALDLGRLKYKSGSLGFLESDAQSGYRRFPHTEVSHYFLAGGIIRGIGEPTVRRVLRRASLETDFFSIFSETFAELPDEDAAAFLARHREVSARDQHLQDRLQANLAALELGALSWRSNVQRLIEDAFLLDAAIVGVASPARLERVTINRLDVRGADLRYVQFCECSVYTLIADDETRFGLTHPDITHLQLVRLAGTENIRGQSALGWLDRHAMHELSPWSEPEDLLWRVIHTLRRRYAIRDSEDDPAGKLLRDPYWRHIEKILHENDRIVRDQSRGASGPNDSFLRIRDPIGLLNSVDETTQGIWRKVAALA